VLPRRYASPVLVAHGGMGQVYRATDSALERTVAVKLLADRYVGDDDARARFRREGLAAARLSAAPNVVTVFDVSEHRGRPLIVMEYLEGGSVYERLRHGRVSREQALLWLEQAASALDEAHAHGVVHRDVKPANLLLDREGNVHVSDFGIASATGADTLTTPGMVLGTAGYLSPEQACGEPATAASDRYALGVVAFELLTGRRPFAGDTPTTEAFAHLHADVPSATSLDPALPSGVDAVFTSALAKDPSERPASARELVERLRDALAGDVRLAPPTLVSPNVPTRVRTGAPTRRLVHRTRRRLAPLVALAALGLLVLGLLVGVLLDSGGDFGDRAAQATARAGTSAAAAETTSTTPPTPNGDALNARGFARMQAGDYDGALPLLRGAVLALAGTGSLTEAYADYNLASSRFAVGRCPGVIGLLDRSERIQGTRREIDELRSRWQRRCAPAPAPAAKADEGSDERPGKHGKEKGKGHD
jgi:eukaryotic-like serine/threonine-protein kinase